MFRTIVSYIAILIAGATLFFFLHHLGNKIPYDLARQRLADNFAVNLVETHPPYIAGFNYSQEYYEISMAVLAGANGGDSPLTDALLLKSFRPQGDVTLESSWHRGLKDIVDGRPLEKTFMDPPHWWGSKALYAIALQYWSVSEILEILRVTSYAAYLLLAVAAFLLARSLGVLIAPVIVFGLLFSNIEYFSEPGSGIPYLWGILAPAILSLLMRRSTSTRPTLAFCFIAGMVSCYVYLFDGHTMLLVPLIGLIIWFGHERPGLRSAVWQAGKHIVLYATGFFCCCVLGVVLRAVFHEMVADGDSLYSFRGVLGGFLERTQSHLERIFAEMTPGYALSRRIGGGLSIISEYRGFLILNPYGPAVGLTLTFLSIGALGIAGGAAWYMKNGKVSFALVPKLSKGSRPIPLRPEWGILWLVALMFAVFIQLLLPSDVPYRTARFWFLPLALCWPCLILVIMQMKRPFGLYFTSLVLFACVGVIILVRTTLRLPYDIGEATLVAQANFDIYMDGHRLIYVRDDCHISELASRFFLHVIPVDVRDLPEHRKPYPFDNLDFSFLANRRLDAECAAQAVLPNYEIAEIRTGQYSENEQLWGVKFLPAQNDVPVTPDRSHSDHK